MHKQMCIIIVQNTSSINLLHCGSQDCSEVKDTANRLLFMQRKVCIILVQNTSSVNLVHFGYQYCIEVNKVHNRCNVCIEKFALIKLHFGCRYFIELKDPCTRI